MRRKEKAIAKEEVIEILNSAEYGVLCTISADNTPYGTPMNFVYVDGAIYFHCAPEGHRIENIKGNHSVCLNVVDSVKLMPEKIQHPVPLGDGVRNHSHCGRPCGEEKRNQGDCGQTQSGLSQGGNGVY